MFQSSYVSLPVCSGLFLNNNKLYENWPN